MARIAILGILIIVFVLLIRAIFPSSTRKKKENLSSETEMVKDPNCETYIPKAEAVAKTVQGKEHFFCSEKCAEEFTEQCGKG